MQTNLKQDDQINIFKDNSGLAGRVTVRLGLVLVRFGKVW
jgi:hypothetical protein